MRENIGLFRGKRKDNGEWVEGSLHTEYGETTKDGNRAIDYRILGMRGECYYVDPDTIGECTGLKDKNGKLIFEGDILSSFWGYKGVVEYDTIIYAKLECLFNEDCEIIGNVTDNPELLKGGEQ